MNETMPNEQGESASPSEAELEVELNRAEKRRRWQTLFAAIRSPLTVWILSLGIAGCTALLLQAQSDRRDFYDEQVVKQAEDVSRKVIGGSLEIGSFDKQIASNSGDTQQAKAKTSYAANMHFYDDVKTDLLIIKLRIEASPGLGAPYAAKALEGLIHMLDDLGRFHSEKNSLSEVVLRPFEMQFRAVMLTIFEFEFRLKAGEDATKETAGALKTLKDLGLVRNS